MTNGTLTAVRPKPSLNPRSATAGTVSLLRGTGCIIENQAYGTFLVRTLGVTECLSTTSPFADLTNEQYAVLGRIVVEWSNIERLLGFLLSRLLMTPEFLGRTYTQGMSAVRVQLAIAEAVEIHRVRYGARRIPEATLASIEALNARVGAIRADRNKVSHFCWVRTNDEEIFGTALSGGLPTPARTKSTERTLSSAQLKRLHKDAYETAEDLMKVVEALPAVDE